jgi:hypothetical protein
MVATASYACDAAVRGTKWQNECACTCTAHLLPGVLLRKLHCCSNNLAAPSLTSPSTCICIFPRMLCYLTKQLFCCIVPRASVKGKQQDQTLPMCSNKKYIRKYNVGQVSVREASLRSRSGVLSVSAPTACHMASAPAASRNYWLLKSEPDPHIIKGVDLSYPFDRLLTEKSHVVCLATKKLSS